MSDLAHKKIVVLKGGPGSERAVSLATGAGVAKALRSLGAEVTEIDVEGSDFVLPDDTELAFLALHGTFGEDGQVQQILEDRGVSYTGENVEKSRLAFDKIESKKRFSRHGVATPTWEIIHVGEQPTLPLPYVIKAPRQGSTVGVYIVKEASTIATDLSEAAKYDDQLLIEQFIPGRELTIGVLGDLALPVLEIIPKSGFYDFNDKYPFLNPQGGGGAQHVCPAEIPGELTDKIQDLALLAARSLGLEVYSRVDIMLSEQNQPSVLEINTIPGMTETSLLPDAAAVAGISYPELCRRIIELSLAARPTKK
ncbi:MAG: D-alanine--D-alanine ligase [Verrucomicrobiota bacterium]|nr:D-alanine--D-alanine ligase [Verrucomicrobiota bacterium]